MIPLAEKSIQGTASHMSNVFEKERSPISGVMPRFLWIPLSVLLLLVLGSGCERESLVDAGIDTIPPLPPVGLLVESARDGYVFISWNKNREADLRGYIVYRAEQKDSTTFLPLDTLANFYFIDTHCSYDTLYSYRITALDRSGNESIPSSTVRARSPNLEAPLAPDVLHVNGSHDADHQLIRLSWSDVDEADVRSFRIYRSTSAFTLPDPRLQIAEVENYFYDDTEISELSSMRYYAITTVDQGGLESPLSPLGADLISPRPLLVSPSVDEATSGRPVFAWRTVPIEAEYRISLSESENAGEIWSTTVAGTVADTMSIQYTGLGLAPGTAWFWRVASITSENGRVNGISDARRIVVKY